MGLNNITGHIVVCFTINKHYAILSLLILPRQSWCLAKGNIISVLDLWLRSALQKAQYIIVFIDGKANNYVARDVEEAHGGDEMVTDEEALITGP